MIVDANIFIERSAAEVFAYVADVTNMHNWVTGVSSAEMLTDEMSEGARFVCRYTSARRPTELEIEVIAYDAPHLIGLRVARGPISFEGTMTLVATDGGTLVTNAIVADPDSVATRLASVLFGWFVRPSMRKRLARELEALRSSIANEEMADA